MSAYYNEIYAYAAKWLRNLVDAEHLPCGLVDERSITDVLPEDLDGHAQCHFFAGIGGWPLALHLAGWPAARPVWTGSCPCQPFSVAGRGQGIDDPRHLWPEWYRLITECRPPTIFGEQVASPAGRAWLADVRVDLEALGYAVGAADLCAASIGAPHIRQRLFFVAHATSKRADERISREDGEAGLVANAARLRGKENRELSPSRPDRICREGEPRVVGNANRVDTGQHARTGSREEAEGDREGRLTGHDTSDDAGPSSATRTHWSDIEWLPCSDGKARPTKPGLFPLAHGLPRGMGRLRPWERRLADVAGSDAASLRRARRSRRGLLSGYGNAIVPQVAAVFIQAVMEARAMGTIYAIPFELQDLDGEQ